MTGRHGRPPAAVLPGRNGCAAATGRRGQSFIMAVGRSTSALTSGGLVERLQIDRRSIVDAGVDRRRRGRLGRGWRRARGAAAGGSLSRGRRGAGREVQGASIVCCAAAGIAAATRSRSHASKVLLFLHVKDRPPRRCYSRRSGTDTRDGHTRPPR